MGTLNLYADRPVRVGDDCRYGEDPSPGWLRMGTVEEIGLRSTRIRSLDQTITTIPNAEFSNMHIVNLTKRDRMLVKKIIGLRLDTKPDQTRLVRAALREMLLAHPRVTNDPARVRMSDYGPNSIDIEIFAYVSTADLDDFLAVQEDLVLRVMDIVKEAGTTLALPPRILYHRRDSGLDSEREKIADRPLRDSGDANTLPFAESPEDYREQITDTTDYKLKGSPDYKP